VRRYFTDATKHHNAVHEFVHCLQHHSDQFDLNTGFGTNSASRKSCACRAGFVAEVLCGFTKFLMASANTDPKVELVRNRKCSTDICRSVTHAKRDHP
jgi:hypothetical protein